MRFDIHATIEYAYDPPAGAGRHLLRLMPTSIPGVQRVISAFVEVDPTPAERVDRIDFFGNPAFEIAYRDSHDGLRFSLTARVEREGGEPPLDLSPLLPRLAPEIAEVRDLGPDSPHHYLSRSDRVRPEPEITAYVRRVTDPAMTVLRLVCVFGAALHADMRFRPEATTVDTDPVEAFRRREGVCQDFSQIMIAGLRGIGIPAAYVSGYLRTRPPPGAQRLEGADAMHAWVRAWCGHDCGWVEFDPTNDLIVGGDHVTVAHGRDYSDVSPVKGMLRLSGTQTSNQAVDVVPLE